MSSFVIDDYRLDITPQGNYPVVYLSQFEDGRDIRFYMLNRGRSFTIPTGISAFVSGLKSNGGYYEHLCTICRYTTMLSYKCIHPSINSIYITIYTRFKSINFIINILFKLIYI